MEAKTPQPASSPGSDSSKPAAATPSTPGLTTDHSSDTDSRKTLEPSTPRAHEPITPRETPSTATHTADSDDVNQLFATTSDYETPPPPPPSPPKRFEPGTEVFVLDKMTRSNILGNGQTVGTATGSLPALMQPRQVVGDRPVPLVPSHYNAPGIFVVVSRFVVRNVHEDTRRASAATTTNSAATDSLNNSSVSNNKIVYRVIPRDCIGSERLVSADLVVEVRFKPGDWVFFQQDFVDHDGTDGVEKERAPIIGAEVLRGQRLYHVHLVHLKCDKLLVKDERLEPFVTSRAE